jgi:hypothetical protein
MVVVGIEVVFRGNRCERLKNRGSNVDDVT